MGAQALADRYTYIPLIGVFIILAFGAADLAAGRRQRQVALSAFFGLGLLACLVLAWRQAGHWRDSESILVHAAAVTENNMMAYFALGQAYDEMGRKDEAIAMFYRAIRCSPKMVEAYNYLAVDLADRGDLATAIPLLQQAIHLQPDYDPAYHNLCLAYLKQGRIQEAREMFETALRKNPDNAGARKMLDSIRDR